MDDETLEKQLALEWKDEDLSEQIEKEEKVSLTSIEICAGVDFIVLLSPLFCE